MTRAVGLGAVTIFSPVVRLKLHPSAGTLQSGDCTRKLPRYVRVGRPRAERSRGELPACQARIERETVRLPVASLARRARRRPANRERWMSKTTWETGHHMQDVAVTGRRARYDSGASRPSSS